MWLLDFLRNLLPLHVTLGSDNDLIITDDDEELVEDVTDAEDAVNYETAADDDEGGDSDEEGYTNVEICPYGPAGRCSIESEYDSQAMEPAAITAIVSEVGDDYVVDALKAASAKIYRGQSCKNCGAWFPATQAQCHISRRT